jgi:hypothetical protein
MIMKTVPVAILAVLLLSSCASIFNRPTKNIQVTSTPPGLSFDVKDRDGKVVQSGTTPASIRLTSRYGFFKGQTYTFTARSGSREVGSMVMYAGLSPWYFGNLLIGGALGMLIIDPATGGMWTLPSSVHIDSGSKLSTLISGEDELRIIALADVPLHLRSKLVRI